MIGCSRRPVDPKDPLRGLLKSLQAINEVYSQVREQLWLALEQLAQRAVCVRVRQISLRREDREDLIQDVLIELWKAAPRYRPGAASLETYLRRVADNHVNDWIKLRMREAATGSDLDAEADRRTATESEGFSFPKSCGWGVRAAFVLQAAGYTVGQIAAVFGVSPNGLSQAMSRAREQFAAS